MSTKKDFEKNIKVAAISLNQIPLAFEHNCNNILKAISDAREKNIQLICFPELCITGYGCEDSFLSLETSRMAIKTLKKILPHTKNMAVALGLPVWHQNNLYNTICFVDNGKIMGFVAKQNLAGDGVHYEPRWFKSWETGILTQCSLNVDVKDAKEIYPFGDQIFDWHGIKIGFEICEDAWVAARTAISLAERGVDIILNPSASHFAFGKSNIRKSFVMEASNDFGVGYIYANLLGNEAGRIIYDGDTLIAAASDMLAVGPRFSYKDYVLTEAIMDIPKLRDYRHKTQVQDKKKVLQEKLSHTSQKSQEQEWNESKGIKKTRILFEQGPHWESSPHIKEEEFTRAVSLALFDYLRKSKAYGFVINLSGGADSSACASLVYFMVLLGIESLGAANFLEKLLYIPAIKELKQSCGDDKQYAQKITKQLLFCLFQGTVNNSKASKEAAQALSQALFCSFAAIEIDTLVENYSHLIEGVIKRDLNFDTDDIALQNIQARVRTPSIWLLANVRRALVISTSNRSEAATGYTTMDGDTAGGISPLAGIDKYFLLQWLGWLEKNGPMGIGGLPVLNKVLALTPSAELRPLNKAQKDEEDLMPFEWLAFIERLFVRDKLSETQILEKALQAFPKAKPTELHEAVQRFMQLWKTSQWKRERLAPSFHLDDESVDPKTWCRFPILSGDCGV